MTKCSVLIFFLAIVCPATVFAEACTYEEALLAQENGNLKRAKALMQMAANDGDQRAIENLKRNTTTIETNTLSVVRNLSDSG